MSDIQMMTTQRLRALIAETETALSELKVELERREKVAQEHEIERLEDHMKNAELSLQSIKNFINYLLNSGENKS